MNSERHENDDNDNDGVEGEEDKEEDEDQLTITMMKPVTKMSMTITGPLGIFIDIAIGIICSISVMGIMPFTINTCTTVHQQKVRR